MTPARRRHRGRSSCCGPPSPRGHPAPPHGHALAALGVARGRQPGRHPEGLLRGAREAHLRLQQRAAHAAAGGRRRAARQRAHPRKRRRDVDRGRLRRHQGPQGHHAVLRREIRRPGARGADWRQARRAGRLLDGALRRHAHAGDGRDRPVPHRWPSPRLPPASGASRPSPAWKLTNGRTRNCSLSKPSPARSIRPSASWRRRSSRCSPSKRTWRSSSRPCSKSRRRKSPAAWLPRPKPSARRRAIVENLGAADGDFLQSVADALKGQFKGVVVLGGTANNAVALVATVSPELTKKIPGGQDHPGHRAHRRREGRGPPRQRPRRRQGCAQAGRGAGESPNLIGIAHPATCHRSAAATEPLPSMKLRLQ